MKDIILYKDKSDCCGCGACMTECPKGAITMAMDEIGALYPAINDDLCIKCGKCMRVCSYKNFDDGNYPIKVVGAISEDKELYGKSASGGVFSALASGFVKDSGMVAGSVEEFAQDKIDIKHIVGVSCEEIEGMYGSKYVQSRAYEVFDDVKKSLEKGEKVLFSGTPCQVAALKKIVPNQENLYTIDLICHGTPPLRLFQDFLELWSKKLHSKIVHFAFRDKSAGKGFRAVVTTKKQKYYLSHGILSYYKLFLDGIIYRKNCYSCPYAQSKRTSDLTIGDFWGIENYLSGEQTEGKFWSCILVNSDKGLELLDKYGAKLTMIDSDLEKVACMNEQLRKPHDEPAIREKYLRGYISNGYAGIEKEYKKHMGGALKVFIKEKRQIFANKSV